MQNGTAAQLDAVTYIGATLAAAIIGERPFASGASGLQQLDAISGVGPSVLGALKTQTATLWCPVAGCCVPSGGPPQPAVTLVINEFALGSTGWVEIYNGGAATVDLAGYSVDDIEGAGSAPKKIASPALIAPKGHLLVKYAGFNASSADNVRLLNPAGVAVDVQANGYSGASLAGVCQGRAPDGGPMAPHNLDCSPGKSNPSPVVPSAPIVTINEFKPGAFGWVEIYNPTSGQAPLQGWSIDDKAGDPSPPVMLGNGVVVNNGFLTVAFGGLSTSSADELRLIDPSGKVVETRSNGWSGTSIAGACQGRLPDGGPWSVKGVTCTPGDINQGTAAPPTGVPQVFINEVFSGTAPWIELYNAGTTPVSTQTLLLLPSIPKASPAVITQFLLGKVELAPKSLTQVPVPMAWLPSKQAAALTLLHGAESGPHTQLDKAGNRFQSTDIAGKCGGRYPIGGAWQYDWLPCSPGAANPKPGPCSAGAACNDGNPCTSGESFTSGCACIGGTNATCADGNACTDDVCSVDVGCLNPDAANGTACGSGKVCNFGNCAGASSSVCTAKGGTYKGVTFSATQECKALEFLNKAPGSSFAWTTALAKLVYDCTPAGTCGYRAGAWTSLVQLTEKVGGCSSSAGTTTMQAIKDQSSAFVAGGPTYDTVAGTWANKAKLMGRILTLESVYVEKVVPSKFFTCWMIRDKKGASNYLHACYQPDKFCDGCMQTCTMDCLTPHVGQKRWLRGVLEGDSTLPGGLRVMLLTGSSCGNSFVQSAANPAIP